MLSVHRRPQRYHPAFHVRWLSPRPLGWLARSKRGPPCLMTERKEDPCQLAQVGSTIISISTKYCGKEGKNSPISYSCMNTIMYDDTISYFYIDSIYIIEKILTFLGSFLSQQASQPTIFACRGLHRGDVGIDQHGHHTRLAWLCR